jgi:hypothetical protein
LSIKEQPNFLKEIPRAFSQGILAQEIEIKPVGIATSGF